jgi:hypothetical protein
MVVGRGTAQQQPRSPGIAALAFFLFGLAQVGAVMHGGVRHERCAEHGELVEASNVVVVHAGAVDHDVVDDRGAAVEDAHDHCALSLLPLAPTAVAGHVVAVAAAAPAAAVAANIVVDEADGAVALAALVNAPKTSPPGAPSPFPRSA